MKKIFLRLSLVVFLGFISCNEQDKDEKNITQQELPSQAKTFMQTYFANASYLEVTKENTANIHKSIYNIELSNGFEVDFDEQGNWTEIESSNKQELPLSFLTLELSNIYKYVKDKYPTLKIVGAQKENYGYSVDLNNDYELIFNQNQEFIAIDLDNDNDNQQIINPLDLPQTAKDFINEHFKNTPENPNHIISVEKDIDGFDVYLSSGYTIEMDLLGNWKDIDSKYKEIPNVLVPQKILDYVNMNYKGFIILEINKEISEISQFYEIEIKKDNIEIDMIFDNNGNFIRIK